MAENEQNLSSIPRRLSTLVRWLEDRDELHRVGVSVDPVLEIAAITDRVAKRPGGGKALLFSNVKGSPFALATNLFGSPQRSSWAWGCDDTAKLGACLEAKLAKGEGGTAALRLQSLLAPSQSPCLLNSLRLPEVEVDLGRLPALQGWPGDGGRFMTLPLISMQDPESGLLNWGIYRMQVLGPRSAALHFLPGSQGERFLRAYAQRGRVWRLAVTLGGDPALLAAAAMPLPRDIDEAAFVGLVTGRPPLLAHAPRSGLPVAAEAEIVMEGEIRPGDWALEGPFGNHTGYYRPAAPAPVFHVTAMYHGARPLFPATVVGPPPTENFWLLRAGVPLLLALLRADHPRIAHLRFFMEGAFHGCALLGLEPAAGPSPLELARLLWREGPLRAARLLVFVDARTAGEDGPRLLWRIFNHSRPGQDLLVEDGRLAVDATRKQDWPEVGWDARTRALIEGRWAEYGLDE